jgi:hypothetical protein
MYEHYEKHRTDNITDPELRQSRPISTISGWEQERDEIHNALQQSQQVQTVPTDDYSNEREENEEQQQLKSIETNRTTASISTSTAAPALINEQQQEQQQQQPRISSISDVYNKEINGENISTTQPIEEKSEVESEVKENGETSKLHEILEQQLGTVDPEEESREIASEIVEEILQKSEALLDECKQMSDDMMNQHETAVIKDEELEQAVHEVVSGVRQIQLKATTDENQQQQQQESEVGDELKSKHEIDTDDKTDTQASAIINDTKQSIAGMMTN